MRRLAFLVVVLAVLMVPAGAEAKGPDQATIHGTGMAAPAAVRYSERAAGDLSTLFELTGFFPATFARTPNLMLPAAPEERLGPKLSITWRVPDGGPTPDTVGQDLYLYAEGGPLTYTTPGQRFLGSQRTTGGWFRTPAPLRSQWAEFGLPTHAALTAAASPTPAVRAPTSDAGSRSSWPGVGVAAAAVVCLGTLASFGVMSRRRVRVSST